MPAFDLRSKARTTGNPPYLPGRFRWAMRSYFVVFGGLALLWGYSIAGQYWLRRNAAQLQLDAAAERRRAALQDEMLGLTAWEGGMLHTQPLLVRLIAELPRDVFLSELVLERDSTNGQLRFRVTINSDRNTSARSFREILGFFQRQGFGVVSIQQSPKPKGTAFEALLRVQPPEPAATAPAQP